MTKREKLKALRARLRKKVARADQLQRVASRAHLAVRKAEEAIILLLGCPPAGSFVQYRRTRSRFHAGDVVTYHNGRVVQIRMSVRKDDWWADVVVINKATGEESRKRDRVHPDTLVSFHQSLAMVRV